MIRRKGSTKLWTQIALAICIIGMTTSCHSGKSLKSGKISGNLTAESLYETLEALQPRYTWLSANGRIQAQNEEIAVSATIQLRMLFDSAIWIKADKLGFEVGRALIRPDSAFIINRLNREYYAVELTEFLAEYNAPFGFADLQRMLAGGTVKLPPHQLKSEPAKEFIKLRINSEEFLGLYWFDHSLLLDHSLLVDLHGRNVEMEFDDYRLVEGAGNIPFERFIKLFDGESTTELKLRFTNMELDIPKSMRFQIPGHYERVD